tara:strand:+ start:267 stop:392 length:126 start_codon:yes stop_codon:yes gene_type:complete
MAQGALIPNQLWWQRQQARSLVLYSQLSEKAHENQWIKDSA